MSTKWTTTVEKSFRNHSEQMCIPDEEELQGEREADDRESFFSGIAHNAIYDGSHVLLTAD